MTHTRLKLRGDAFVVTDPHRRLHGATGPTKAEILAYYVKIAPRIMPFLWGRPVSTVWIPDDSTQEFRFLRLAPAGFAGRFPTCRLPSRVEPYLTVPDRSTLAALVDHGCLSFHPWNSTTLAAHRPTQIVFNLDREAIAFREVRNAALLLRDLLGDYGLAAWVKTSGGQGLHVLVPVTGGASFDDVAVIAETIVRHAIRREARLFSRDQRGGRRRGRILLDISRNEPGATLIAPYGVTASGLVSALLDWDELTRPMYPEDFSLDRVLARKASDLKNQARFFRANQSLGPLAGRTRSRRMSVTIRPCVHGYPQCLVDRRAVVGHARTLRAESGRLQAQAEVARIESANTGYRSEKLREQARRLLRR